jgi:peptide/nickel transport system ATP-binding protein
VTGNTLLSVEDIVVDLPTPRGNLRAVDHVDLTVGAGQTLGVVGESGCGKTMLSRAVLQLLPKKAKLSGRVMFDGQDLLQLHPEKLRKLRGRSLAVVFQDPMTSLNPVLTIGTQLIETLQEHLELDDATAKKRSVELLAAVGIPAPEQRLAQYPHQLSGGMRQRVAIAIALSCEPKLLIADEPTTALDVTIQAQILDLLAREQRRRHMAMILITHDLGVVAGRTDDVAVMYAGRVVERAPTPALFKKMRMPYTEALLAALPRLDAAPHTPLPAISGRPPDPTRPLQGCSFSPRCRYAVARCQTEKPALEAAETSAHQYACFRDPCGGRRMMQQAVSAVSNEPLLAVDDLVVEYPVGAKIVHAVSGVSLQVARGETLGLVGESGCGKSTLGRAVLQLRRPTSGRVLFDGHDLTTMQGDALRLMRRRVQLIFQDPIASLNPRRRIGDIVAEPLVIAGVKDREKREQLVHEVLSAVGLDPTLVVGRLPHEFSGGQCQRICIARALILNPEFIVCDEPVSALDVSIRAQILNLLEEMKGRFGLTLLFIAHDLAVVKAVSDRVAVMYLGRLCEVGPSEQLFARPAHPYTALLIEAIPVPDPDVRPTETVPVGEPPSPIAPPSGCRFRTRCPRADQRCSDEMPELRAVAPGQFVACHHPLI